MILGPISLLDCAVFVIFLLPSLLVQVGILKTIRLIIQALPFLGSSSGQAGPVFEADRLPNSPKTSGPVASRQQSVQPTLSISTPAFWLFSRHRHSMRNVRFRQHPS